MVRATSFTAAPGAPGVSPPLDFAGGADAVLAVAEALHLAYGHRCNPAFASETARIDPLPHQRIAVYERMLRQDPLRRTVEDMAAGRLAAADLRSARLPPGDADDTDILDALADADAGGEDTAAGRAAAYEAAVLGAVVAVTIDELHEEIATIDGLIARADRLIEAGAESKFERFRAVLDDRRYARDKWLVFSEHRDTVDYLIGRLEGLGHAGRIVSIHGGMAWPEREAAVERFREPDGARFLVATDAAGEGINLQFCRLMVNYDVPWNPARLEQRLGRIHRYGQRRDVVIVNLVATSTRKGRVLRVLLDKLDVIREELRSDKVFDVIGRLVDNRSLGDYLIEALTDDGERRVRDRLNAALTTGQVGRIEAADARIYGRPGEVADRLDALAATSIASGTCNCFRPRRPPRRHLHRPARRGAVPRASRGNLRRRDAGRDRWRIAGRSASARRYDRRTGAPGTPSAGVAPGGTRTARRMLRRGVAVAAPRTRRRSGRRPARGTRAPPARRGQRTCRTPARAHRRGATHGTARRTPRTPPPRRRQLRMPGRRAGRPTNGTRRRPGT